MVSTPPDRLPWSDLEPLLSSGSLVRDADVVGAFRSDRARTVPAGMPAAVVRARSRRDVAETLRWAGRNSIAVVPRGAGSGLSGGANATDGGIVLALDRFDRILDVDEEAMTIRVEPGALNGDVAAAAAAVGLEYAPDPASRDFSTIGGNVATNAGGLCCVKYGVTRDSVLELEAVLHDGRTLRCGRRTLKGVVGLDLASLLVGSEGTLGVVTEALLRLRPRRPASGTLLSTFSTLDDMARAVVATVRTSTPTKLEIMDRVTLAAVREVAGLVLEDDPAGVLLCEVDARSEVSVLEELALLEPIHRAASAIYTASTVDAEEAALLWGARKLAYPSLEALGNVLLDDVCVPVPALAEMLRRCHEISERHDVRIATFGHAGDGNLHPTIVHVPGQDVSAPFAEIVDEALALGGTATGEHGIGLLKRRWLNVELDPVAAELQAGIRGLFDPFGILSPGRGVPSRSIGAP